MEEITPENALEMGLAHHRAGRLAQAEGIYRKVLEAQPDHVGATRMLGIIASQCGKHDDAIALLNKAAQGNDPDALLDLAVACRAAGRADEAEAAYRRATDAGGDSPKALMAYGQYLKHMGRHEEAIGLFRWAAELQPGSVQAQNMLGISLAEVKRFDEAEVCFRKCLEIEPTYVMAYNNLGTGFLQQSKPAEAEKEFRKAIEVDPNYALAYDNLGNALIRQGRQIEAVPVLERAIELKPDLAGAHESLGWAKLALGEWDRAFAEMEWRLNRPGRSMLRPDIRVPQWGGEELAGKTILLHAEAGVGDAIQFARYVPLVARRGGRVVILCIKALVRLLGSVQGVVAMVSPEERIPRFDVHCSLLSLPHIFRTTPETVPSAKAAYLSAPAELVQKWKDRLAGESGKRVGIAWAGDMKVLEPLGGVAGVRFYQLSKAEHQPAEGAMAMESYSAELEDLAELAAALKNLELVITDDSVVAHLAGALGRPTVLMLEAVADCRWMLERSDSPWYGSVKLYRQKTAGEWGEVVERVKRSLAGWAKK